MCLAEGASLSTAETVPGESPTCAATDLSVTALPFVSAVFLICVMSPSCGNLAGPVQRYLEGGLGRPTMAFGASHYMATRTGHKYFHARTVHLAGRKKPVLEFSTCWKLQNGRLRLPVANSLDRCFWRG